MQTLRILVLLALLGGVLYVYREPVEELFSYVYAETLPCRSPIRYTIGDFDARFGISKDELLVALRAAENIWEKPVGKDLFAYNADSGMPIHLIYDQRQATTEKLRELDGVVDQNLASYEGVRVQFETLRAEYVGERADFNEKAEGFDAAQSAHAREVRRWNDRGGAPPREYKKLEAEKAELERELAELKQLENSLNAKAERVNEMVDTLNTMARNLNLNVAKYNTVGKAVPDEFEEGMYTESLASREIDIYEFESEGKLVRVLAHEFGHALGLEHVEDESAIMYRINKSSAVKASSGDIAELKRRCAIQ